MNITTHVLDTSRGRPAAGVPIVLSVRGADGSFSEIGSGSTDKDGRLRSLIPEGYLLAANIYRLTFDTKSYFAQVGAEGFYPEVVLVFEVKSPAEHYHVPLLISPFGYSTYRGS